MVLRNNRNEIKDELTGGIFALFINKRELSIGDQAFVSKPSLRTVDV
jgi:hypothetical protein